MGQDFTAVHKEYFYDMPIDLCCVIDANTRKIIQANPAFEYILGWKSTEIQDQLIDAFVQNEMEKNNIEKTFSKLKLGIHSFTFETAFRTKNNATRHIDWKCYLDDEHQWIFAIGHDITLHKEAQKNLAQQSRLDPLTGVNDRQTFLTLVQNELHNAIRYHFSLAVILIDIDRFKEYSAQYAVQKSDDCLKHVAAALKTCLRRKTDFLARFETTRFAVLLSHNDFEKSMKAAEYLRASFEKLATSQNVSGEPRNTLSISLGVSAISEKQEKEITSDQMLGAAMRALTVSQQNGGNQVNFAGDFV